MKYNYIEKFQRGGGFATFTPIIEQQPVTETKSSSGSEKESKHTISSMLDDDVFKDLMGKGLVNDVNGFVAELAKIESASSGSMYPYAQSNNRAMSLRLVGKINELKNSKGNWDNAVTTATAAGGYGEVAVNNDMVYGKDAKGNISAINVNDYDKHRNQYRLLSVAELLNERQYNPKLTGQNGLFDVANNAIGLDKIKSNLKELIAAVGTEDSHTEKFFSREQLQLQSDVLKTKAKPTKDEKDSMEYLKHVLETPGEYYKITSENSSERNHINEALDYLWKTLDSRAQQKLKATAIINGGKDPRQFIADMFVTNTSAKTASMITPEKLPGSTEADGSSKGMANVSYFETLHNGKLGSAPMQWNDPSTGKKMTLHVAGAGRLTEDDKPLGMTTFRNVASTKTGTLLDVGKATFGDKVIGAKGFDNIIVSDQTAAKVYMPANSDGTANFARLKQFNAVQAEIEKHKGEWTPAIINDYYKSHGFDYVQVGKDFVVKENALIKPFLVMYGYTAQNANEVDGNAEVKILDSDEKDNISQSLQNVWKANKVKAPTDWTEWGTDYYKGIIAVPYVRGAGIIAASIAGHMQGKQQNITDARVDLQKYETPQVNAGFSFFTNK